MIFGIMGAMPDEVDQLCARLENVTVEPYGGVEYHKGTLAGKQVVVCCAGMGSYIKNENPLSTYHHLSKTLYSSHLQSGDRLKEELIKPVWKKL